MDTSFSSEASKIKTQLKEQKTYVFNKKDTFKRMNTQNSQISRLQTKSNKLSINYTNKAQNCDEQKSFNKSRSMKNEKHEVNQVEDKQSRFNLNSPFSDQKQTQELQSNAIKIQIKQQNQGMQKENKDQTKGIQLNYLSKRDSLKLLKMSSILNKTQALTSKQKRRVSIQNSSELKGFHLNLLQLRNQRRQSVQGPSDFIKLQTQYQKFESFQKKQAQNNNYEEINEKVDTASNSKKNKEQSQVNFKVLENFNSSKFDVNDSYLPRNFQNFNPDSFSNFQLSKKRKKIDSICAIMNAVLIIINVYEVSFNTELNLPLTKIIAIYLNQLAESAYDNSYFDQNSFHMIELLTQTRLIKALLISVEKYIHLASQGVAQNAYT